ncbi:ketoacyl-ACP synthase III [bacterium]|nr:ketoacyl-ACP synthase III [bacterium]
MKNSPKSMIAGMGSAVPEKVLTNFDLEKMVDTSDKWIRERTGIQQRHILEEGKTNSDLAQLASRRALSDAGISVEELDCIIVATITPDAFIPSTACQVQAKIGAVNAAAMDISAACSGFLYAMILADKLIASGQYHNILIIGSEVLSRFTDWEDRATCVLFGDGAGAAVIVPSDGEKGILSSYMKSDGRLGDLLNLPGGGSTHPASYQTIDQRLHYIKMAGQGVFKHAVRTMVDAAVHGLKQWGHQVEDIDLLITHQANVRIIDAVAKRVKIPKDKVFINVQQYGNTSAASIPLAMDQAKKEGRLKEGDLCLLVAFGGGFTWASSVVQF